MTLDNTNVKSIHTGRDILKDLALQDLRYVVTTMAIPWSICREQLTGDPLAVIHADSMERRVVEKQIEALLRLRPRYCHWRWPSSGSW